MLFNHISISTEDVKDKLKMNYGAKNVSDKTILMLMNDFKYDVLGAGLEDIEMERVVEYVTDDLDMYNIFDILSAIFSVYSDKVKANARELELLL